MRLFWSVTCFILLWSNRCLAQMDGDFSTHRGFEDISSTSSQPRGRMRSFGDQKIARNILIVKAVSDYKSGDEKYEPDFKILENNREYQEKLRKILDNLSNKKRSDAKNREAINILNDAGNKLYNLLAN